jgi:N-methylhydantoinase A/oxoprolinase/acetone carboxylase beta subunit
MRFMLGVDVGGTFTDFVSYNAESKSIEVWKEPSAPGDPATATFPSSSAATANSTTT